MMIGWKEIHYTVQCITVEYVYVMNSAFFSQLEGHEIYTGSIEGNIGVYKYDAANRTLGTAYVMETESSLFVPLRRLAAMAVYKGKMFLGDSGPNVKVLHWKKSKHTHS